MDFVESFNHYVKVDKNGYVIKSYSDAFQPFEEGDYFVETSPDRNYNLELVDYRGYPKYKIFEGVLTECNDGDWYEYLHTLVKEPTELEKLRADIDYLLMLNGEF